MRTTLAASRRWLGVFALLAVGAGTWQWAVHLPQDRVETLTLTRPLVTAAPAPCPWRDPQGDLRVFFPTADRYQTRMVSLSGSRLPILKRLGPAVSLASNSLSVFPLFHGTAPRGAVLIQRAAGEYGVIEVVVGVDTVGRVQGVRLQRLREPDRIARALTDPPWLRSFRGKTAADPWRLGGDVPDRPAPARASARIIVGTVRSLLIEYDVVRRREEQLR